MNFLKRELAPLSQSAWDAIDERAKRVLSSILSVRKFARYNGAKGYDYKAIPTGRLSVNKSSDVHYGVNLMLPLIEERVNFVVNRWEMDNVSRGAQDIDFKSLEDALYKTVSFAEKSVYNGLDDACIVGLINSSTHDHLILGETAEEVLRNIAGGMFKLKDSYSGNRSFALVVSEDIYTKLNSMGQGYDFINKIKEILDGGKIISSKFLDRAILVPFDSEDIELTIGQDYSIGYQEHTETDIKLFVTLTFTFRVTDPTLVVVYDK